MEKCPDCGNTELECDKDGDADSELFGETLCWCEKCGWCEWDY